MTRDDFDDAQPLAPEAYIKIRNCETMTKNQVRAQELYLALRRTEAGYEFRWPILNEAERDYLSKFLKPWMESFELITVCKRYCDYENDRYYLRFRAQRRENGIVEYWTLPAFKGDTMYKGMEPARLYSLEELGL